MGHIRRNLRNQARPLEMSDNEFRANYRLSKEVFRDLCGELGPLLSTARRQTKISIECRVLTALSFYASGSYQKYIGMSFLHGVSQATVSKIVNEVTLALNDERILRQYIRFPQTRQERQAVIQGFSNKFGFPGVMGCIDGTHVALFNLLQICDSDLNILNIDATFGGATHDANILWRNSPVCNHMQQLHENGEITWLLGL
ncbi:hypothetical protein NQ315_014851 [Exocentrus adspersus]|uniref:Nuclease HARBI1 n=1 Tax=Exocentrus adspersus TaxID=1586481 RepID=A0AAV8VKR3_9CUCU|nr:hypothetical protein NQ315_014851 [Exocentrus adspersus]